MKFRSDNFNPLEALVNMHAKKYIPLFLLAFMSSCTSSFNPLDDYEQLQPVTILETPEPAANIRMTRKLSQGDNT